MTRVASGAVLVLLAIAVVWFAPAPLLLAVAEAVVLIALTEYVALARASGVAVPRISAGVAAAFTCAAVSGLVAVRSNQAPLDLILIAALVVLGGMTMLRWRGGPDALGSAAAAVYPSVYLGLPLGTMVAVREAYGPETLFLLMGTVMVSDMAQYYSGRAFGRHLLAPAISPKKTVEGAVGGFIFGGLFMSVVGRWWLPSVPLPPRAALGAGVVGVGIVGDLFESMLKRSAGAKDSSKLIPGHGGILDRIDALLFAAPAYYVVLRYL
jgi:phosphatidate cytidylyltransferase